MLTNNLGYPRIGNQRELKKACENYWAGKITLEQLTDVSKQIKRTNWQLQKETGIDLIPSNDFSLYDQALDLSLMVGAIPPRYESLKNGNPTDLYFAMVRGYQKDGKDVTAMEMTKWFDTNYHYIVPEFYKNQQFKFTSAKTVDEFKEAKEAGFITKPVLISPVSYLLLGKEKEDGFNRIELLENLLPVYIEIIEQLVAQGTEWIQFDEPFLSLDVAEDVKIAITKTYSTIRDAFPDLKLLVATYFDGLGNNTELAASLPICALHIDLVRGVDQLDEILKLAPKNLSLSLGIVDGRNIWKNNYQASLKIIDQAKQKLGKDRIIISPSCSLLHVPCDLENETNDTTLTPEIKQWLAFARQKLEEVTTLRDLAISKNITQANNKLKANIEANETREQSTLIHNSAVKQRTAAITETDATRNSVFSIRKKLQEAALNLPSFPTTTIGSFPQTAEVRSWRAKLKKGDLTKKQYDELLKKETEETIRFQEEAGLDVLVHGEFERNDMVEYFGEQLSGFSFTKNGWVQSYGSRCVKPPVIYGDVSRPEPMTLYWTQYAQSLTNKPVKGMLTGPVTILQWSFVRNDQPRYETCTQIALAIRDEVNDLERAGVKIIQIDEPAIREGLPLKKTDWAEYLNWAIRAFRISASGVSDSTQIHTHMCYSEFNDIIEDIAAMDADVITIECSRSQMELLEAFADFKYPNDIGPGVYDIHSPRVPSKQEMITLLEKAKAVIPSGQLWVNPDCGLKTRHWPETKTALKEMVDAAKALREIEVTV
ncbi:5-methyltetrahydropteroyltriglutamate--homocysteine S-methyltransferase [Flavobacterium sp. Sd200]|uniref:5-methyltetrahydropteroyltriglutamate-- homocysteine S-methyltransferase n=1 Tax=Flavobacterium sp. Sd200 TaxID=2692211 RepID=UPI00136A2653|nr:5-methyltetrahydropteroyltriglutamate--homocysteine S-methyltransferase [Flavobacterium sp. Sd200]MXN92261.1 5-methyltetrahydropteroyltriglutamate--homocysteine S-methyltransferase [Flavobacterium sp. Sd200]